MPYVSLRGLGLIGLIADKPTHDLNDNAFSMVSNVRFFDATAQKSSTPVERYTINADAIWSETYLRSGLVEYTYATEDKIYEIVAGTSNDVSRAIAYTSSEEWQSMVWSESPIYNNGVDDPQIREAGDALFKDLPNWPANLQAKVLRPFKNFIVALNITDGGVDKPNFVQWSDESEPGEVPGSWVPLPTNLAGGNPLSGEVGDIIDGFELNDVFIIYSRVAAYEMSFIGGSLVMGFRKILDLGLVARNAVCAFDHYHLCISNFTIFTHDGHSEKHIGDQRVRDFLFNSTSNTDSIKCVHVAATKEVFIYFESDGSGTGEANKALIWCYRYDTWSFVDMPQVRHIEYGPDQPIPVLYGDGTANPSYITTTYAQETRTYAQMSDESLTPRVYLLSSGDDVIYDYDTEFGIGLNYSIERTGLDFDETLGVPTNSIKYIDEIIPQISGTGVVSIELGFSDNPEGAVTWGDPVEYDIATDYKADFRTSGRYPAWRFTGNDEGNFKLSGIDFNVLVDGER